MNSSKYFEKLDYVMESYILAREEYEVSMQHSVLREHYMPIHLDKAANFLCDSLTRLLSDCNFYNGLEEFQKEFEDNRQSVKEIFTDLGDFFELEYKILVDTGVPPDVAGKLVAEMARSMLMVEDLPNIEQIFILKDRIQDCCKAICEARMQEPYRQENKNFFALLRPVGIGLTIAGGVTIITTNAIAAATIPVTLGSIAAGSATIGGGLVAMS